MDQVTGRGNETNDTGRAVCPTGSIGEKYD